MYANDETIDLDVNEDGYRERVYECKGKTFKLRSSDPYGLIKIHTSKGNPSKELTGSYTTFELAETDIERYMGTFVPPNPDNPEVEVARKRVLVPKPAKQAKVKLVVDPESV